jgi:hypothetical protein
MARAAHVLMRSLTDTETPPLSRRCFSAAANLQSHSCVDDMGCCESSDEPMAEPPLPPLKPGVTRICVAGNSMSQHVGRARKIAGVIAHKFPERYEFWMRLGMDHYAYITAKTAPITFPEHLKGHETLPFVWLQTTENAFEPIGGRSHLAQWALERFPNDPDIAPVAAQETVPGCCCDGDNFHAFGCCAWTDVRFEPTVGVKAATAYGPGADSNPLLHN